MGLLRLWTTSHRQSETDRRLIAAAHADSVAVEQTSCVLPALHAVVSQLVESHLAKVEVAGSSPVYRSRDDHVSSRLSPVGGGTVRPSRVIGSWHG